MEDTENGATITGEFTTELLQETINNPETGYRYNPKVTCGPYLFESFDEASQQATLKVNPEFAGDYRGVKPMIETLIIKTVVSRHHDERAGERFCGPAVQLLRRRDHQRRPGPGGRGRCRRPHLHAATVTASCSSTAACSPPTLRRCARPLLTAWTATSSPASTPAATAAVVHSFYGLAQWEYAESVDWINENLNTYDMNVDAAKQLLEEDGWTLNADGTPYSGTGTRYKDVDGELKPLTITWCQL